MQRRATSRFRKNSLSVAVDDPLIQSFMQALNTAPDRFHSFTATRDAAIAQCNPAHSDETARNRLRHWTMESIALGWLDLRYPGESS